MDCQQIGAGEKIAREDLSLAARGNDKDAIRAKRAHSGADLHAAYGLRPAERTPFGRSGESCHGAPSVSRPESIVLAGGVATWW